MFWHFTRLFGVIFIVLALGGAVLLWLKGSPEHAIELLSAFGMAGLVISPALGLVLSALTIPWRCSLAADGISGRSYLGFRRSIRYKDIGISHIENSNGFSLLWITDAASGKQMVMYLDGLELADVYAALVRFAGPKNPLTLVFDPGC